MHKNLVEAITLVQKALTGLWINRGWLEADKKQPGEFTVAAEVDDHKWPLTTAAYPDRRLFDGPPTRTEHYEWDEGLQHEIHSVVDYISVLPMNIWIKRNPSRRVGGFDAEKAYVVPTYDYKMHVDAKTAKLFLDLHMATSEAELTEPYVGLDMTETHILYDNNVRFRLSRIRALLNELTVVVRLKQAKYGMRTVCFCRQFWPKRGQCSHELLIRFLEGESDCQVALTKDLTRGGGSRTVRDIHSKWWSQAVGGMPINIPRGRPLETAEIICAKAIARIEACKKRTHQKKASLREMFRSPGSRPEDKKLSPEEEAERRKRAFGKIHNDLTHSSDFRTRLSALETLVKLEPTLQELNDTHLGLLLRKFKDCFLLKQRADSILMSVSREAAMSRAG